MHHMQPMHHMHQSMGYGSIWYTIFTIAFWAAIVLLIVLLSRNHIKNKASNQTPVQILKARLAKGEIDEEEYSQLTAILSESELK